MKIIVEITPDELGISEATLKEWEKEGRARYNRSTKGWLLADALQSERVRLALIDALQKGNINYER